jgi:hypothetical protein
MTLPALALGHDREYAVAGWNLALTGIRQRTTQLRTPSPSRTKRQTRGSGIGALQVMEHS